MEKKRDLANKHIERLIDELVSYEEAYVSHSCCPFEFNLFGAELIDKPSNCFQMQCESCKEDFYLQVNDNLRKKFIVNWIRVKSRK